MTSPVEKFKLTSFATADELAGTVACAWLDEIEKSHRAGKLHCVALSGGRIIKSLFASVVEQAKARTVSFDGVHFFWADERCVPPNDPESNFRMADDLLFKPLKISENQIHRIRGEDSPKVSVNTAEEELRRIILGVRFCPFPQRGGEVGSQPVLDLIFLGMGEDGHVASLFPDASAEIIHCAAPFLAIEHSPKPPPRRISLSFAAIAAARQVWVLVSGTGKERALHQSLHVSGSTPLARIIQLRQKTWIFSQIEAGKII